MAGGTRSPVLMAALLLATAAAGCLGEADDPGESEPLEAANETAPVETPDPWGGSDRSTLYERTFEGPPAFETDQRCTGGGGPLLDRTGALIRPGTDHLAIELTVPVTTQPGVQVGYVLDPAPAAHEADQEGITWTEAVAPGESATIQVPVSADQIETNGTPVWAFYHRLNPGQDELCYTGLSVGGFDLTIAAVRG